MNGSPGWFKNILRSLFSALDSFGYWILGGVYNVFFAVSSAEIISGDVVREFFSRIQLILGVIMVFKLTFTALSIIINPESATDKQKGAGKILTRVAAALVMLTLVVPISIPASDDSPLNARIRDQGILFGFLYQFQDSVVKDNILGKLILGSRAEYNSDGENGSMNAGGEIDNMADVGGVMAATVAKAFVTPTILSSADDDAIGSLNDIATNNDDNTSTGDDTSSSDDENKVDPSTVFACADTTAYNYYMNPNASADGILYYLNETCDSDDGEVYVFQYTLIGGLVCSIIMTIIILGFTIDIAVRAIKLAVLRLIAPIPIISYISPGSEKDGAFGNWVKTLISTYLDLFIRLAIIYFGAYVILLISRSFSGNGVEIIQTDYGFVINTLATIFIIIGVLVFMKQAPKFLKDMLGLKGTPMGNAGLSGILGGAAMAIGGGGLAGFGLGALQGMSTSAEATGQGKAFSPFQSWAQNRDQMAKIRTGDKDAKGGIIGSAMDRLLYKTRERQLAAKGLTSENADLAKNAFYAQQDVVHNAQVNRDLAWEKLKSTGVTSNPSNLEALVAPNRDDFISTEESPIVDTSGRHIQREVFDQQGYDAAVEQYNQQVAQRRQQQALWDDFIRKDEHLTSEQSKLGRMEKNSKNINQARQAAGVDPRLYDEYVDNRRAYRAGGHRARFNPYSSGEPSNLDDIGFDAGMPEIGGHEPGPPPGPGGPGHRP